MIIALDGVAAGIELWAIVDDVVETGGSVLVVGVEDEVYSVNVSTRASLTA